MNNAEKREAIAWMFYSGYKSDYESRSECLDAGKKADVILKICQPDTENLSLLTDEEKREISGEYQFDAAWIDQLIDLIAAAQIAKLAGVPDEAVVLTTEEIYNVCKEIFLRPPQTPEGYLKGYDIAHKQIAKAQLAKVAPIYAARESKAVEKAVAHAMWCSKMDVAEAVVAERKRIVVTLKSLDIPDTEFLFHRVIAELEAK